MKFRCICLSIPVFLCVLANCFALDREAFSISRYDLNVRIDPAQQRLGARGTITLHNDSSAPQKSAILQISSSLHWLSIKAKSNPLPFTSQTYNSDIDHTGVLSEAVITLMQTIEPGKTVELEIAYEGIIPLDATRLTRMNTPESNANETDWDQIGAQFTAVRGAGYVTWYPIATDAASLAQGNDLFETLGRWKARESGATMRLHFAVTVADENEKPELLVNATSCPVAHEENGQFIAECSYQSLGATVPTFIIANYEVSNRPDISVHFLRGDEMGAAAYADAAEKVVPLITDWFGAVRSKAETADLPNTGDVPFESGSLLLTPVGGLDAKAFGLIAAHQLTHAAIVSQREWINEGLAHFAQALYLEQQKGRQAALDYMATHRFALQGSGNGNPSSPDSADQASRSLINGSDEQLVRTKAMYVWWMLRDLVGDAALKKAIKSYRAAEDKEPSYMQGLIHAQTQKDLEWFFDDWVYRDRGLPDFKIESAFSRKLLPEGYIVTITVSNAGAAGAEVPLIVKSAGEDVIKRLVVRGKSSAVIRVETVKPPEEIVVNDGSVPESDVTNNVFKVPAVDASSAPL